MILVKPSAEIIAMTQWPLGLIEQCGRLCYKSEDKITAESAKPFIEMILKRGHESVIEHASASVKFICDRGVSHEIVRHRLASYSQESTRYCDYNNSHVAFIIPLFTVGLIPSVLPIDTQQMIYDTCSSVSDSGTQEWLIGMSQAENTYFNLRKLNWKPEEARSVLPNSLKTEIIMTCNLRNWRHFFKLRTAKAAHPQMRELTIPLLEQFKKAIPIVFDDINP